MFELDKVISGLEHCRIMCEGLYHNPCKGCPYYGNYISDCADTLKAEALALLKDYKSERLDWISALSEMTVENDWLKEQVQLYLILLYLILKNS